jgi:SPOR domain
MRLYMDFRYLSFLIIFIFRSIISCSQSDSSTLSKQIVNIDNKSGIITNPQENITEKPVQAFSKDMAIQVGAFHQEVRAVSLRNWLAHMIDKPVVLVSENGFFKVRINGFDSIEEIDRIIPILGLLGIKNLWVFRPKEKEDIKVQPIIKPDTILNVAANKIDLSVVQEERKVLSDPTFDLKVGVFYKKSKALRAQRRIKAKLKLTPEIINEWEYYIVLIRGFKTREEIFKYYPKLAAMGYPDSFMIENRIKQP